MRRRSSGRKQLPHINPRGHLRHINPCGPPEFDFVGFAVAVERVSRLVGVLKFGDGLRLFILEDLITAAAILACRLTTHLAASLTFCNRFPKTLSEEFASAMPIWAFSCDLATSTRSLLCRSASSSSDCQPGASRDRLKETRGRRLGIFRGGSAVGNSHQSCRAGLGRNE